MTLEIMLMAFVEDAAIFIVGFIGGWYAMKIHIKSKPSPGKREVEKNV